MKKKNSILSIFVSVSIGLLPMHSHALTCEDLVLPESAASLPYMAKSPETQLSPIYQDSVMVYKDIYSQIIKAQMTNRMEELQ